MDNAVHSDPGHGARLREFAISRQVWIVGLLFAALLAIQAIGFLMLGTGRQGLSLVLSILVLDSLISLACAWVAFRRAHGITALFWFLFVVNLAVLLVPTVFQAYDTVFGVTTLSDPTRNLLYCIYGAPILMMLFLPDTYGRERVKAEIFLDLFQIAIVVGLIYFTFFFLPLHGMLPAEALRHDVTISDEQSLILLVAAFVRLQLARIPSTRAALIRLVYFLLVCAVATFVGDWIDLRHYASASAWFNLGWAIPLVAGGLLPLSWTPSPEPSLTPKPANFLNFLGTNLILVSMLSCVHLLTDRWKQVHGEVLTNVAVAASLLAFTIRLALTQFHQQREITQREAAQKQLTASNEQVGLLLDDARRQTEEITQISELGSLLQACTSREEVFRLIPERLRRLFTGASGCISLLSSSQNRVESAAEWGVCQIAQIFSPEQCWAFRRGRTHAHPGGTSALRCSHLLGDGPSVCVPLIANGDTIGTLSIQEDDPLIPVSNQGCDCETDSTARRHQLAAAVAEHIALSVANLNLREALRMQAIRDPLTGLYNRRYMQEFLDRELHSARRKHRPLTVMMLDLDHFKRYNDTFGHAAGDRALAAVGETLLRCVRAEDVACRYGGEEFALILPECSLRQATVRANEIRQRLREFRTQSDGQVTDPLTVSIGVAAFDETTDRVDLLLKFADDALYQAKRAGRDRVIAATPASVLLEANFTEADPDAITSSNEI
jgi:diguanylate cyclase (GGDEF)-like protein